MPKFQVEQYEIHVRTYVVIAASAADAVAEVLSPERATAGPDPALAGMSR